MQTFFSEAALREKIKSGDIGGGYIFAGDEDYLKRHYIKQMAEIASPDESFALFNHIIFDGEEIDFSAVREAVSAPPMMSDFKLIEWRYARLEGLREGDMKRLSELSDFLGRHPYAVLIFMIGADGLDVGTAKRPSKAAVKLGELFSLVSFEYSADARLRTWLARHFSANGIEAPQEVLSALIFRSGHSMDVLSREVDKLSAYALANSKRSITEADVELVASSTVECDAFALSSAITDRNRERAFLALSDMKGRRIEPTAVLATLGRAFGELLTVSMLADEGMRQGDIEAALKWNPFKIKICLNASRAFGTAKLSRAHSRLGELDAMSKSGGISGFTPIELFLGEYL